MAAQTEVRTIIVKADAKSSQAFKEMSKQLGSINSGVSSLSKGFGLLQKVATFGFLGLGVRGLMDMSDSVQTLKDRLKILTGSTGEAERAFEALRGIANETKTSISDIGTIYARLANSTKSLGATQQQLLLVTKTLQNSFRLSGATATEATAASIQLSQGFASGQLRGQELRSVLEANVVAGDILSKSFGKTRGEIYKMAEAGQITADKVFIALLQASKNVNKEAEGLSQTFDQSLTVALGNFSVKVAEINKSLGLSSGLAKSIDILSNNLDSIVRGVTKLVAVFAAWKIFSWISSVGGLSGAFKLLLSNLNLIIGVAVRFLLTLNPITAAIGLAVGALIYFTDGVDDLKAIWNALISTLEGAFKTVAAFGSAMFSLTSVFTGNSDQAKRAADSLGEYVKQIGKADSGARKLRDTTSDIPFFQRESKAFDPMSKDIGGVFSSLLGKDPTDTSNINKVAEGSSDKKDKELKKYKLLNDAFRDGKISIDGYAEALRQADDSFAKNEFDKGKKSLFELNEQIAKSQIDRLNQSFYNGSIAIEEYKDSINSVKLQQLNEEVAAGTMNLADYESAVIKISDKLGAGGAFRVGVREFITDLGTMSEDIAAATKNAFSSLEDSFTQFIKTGTQDWKAFTQGILDDLIRITVRAAIVRPLANGILNLLPTGGTGGFESNTGPVNAGGQFMTNQLAKGGIVSSPTFMGFTKGRGQIAGEAGPEAVLPLSRGMNGDLGVSASITPVTVNIVNNTGANIEQRETTGADGSRSIDLIITNKVKEGIASGVFDRAMANTYGLQRRGV